jgi:Dynamin family
LWQSAGSGFCFRPSPLGATTQVGVTLSVRQFRRQQVGCKLEACRSDLIKCGRELQSRRAFRGSSFVDDSLRLLDRLTCRIGLIGQVKAGKSSLTNALACKPDMLPTDVNPFTTVVTNLHFGRTDVPTDVAAEFTFFQANEWEQLAAGVRHIRELTERMVPGFDVEQLHKQVDALRRRSEQRLGAGLGALLGQKHVFSSLSSELLNRYVASDLSSTGTEEKEAYSDIVKAADLYFASSDFGFPTTIIDTPGTNDPFLVRDEIARRALESAHVHIVVLTSRQAMSSTDVALLRILQGLRKDRIAVFINRIDELGNIARDVPVIVQHVRNGLRRELPTLELPVVAGSAYWANAALRGSNADVERAWSKNAKAYAQHLTPRAGSAADHDGDEQMAQSLLLCSGVPALLDVVAALTLESQAGRALKRISQSFYELANVSQNTARQELAVIESEAKSGDDPKKRGEDELRAVDAEAKEHERLTQALQSMLTDLKERSALTISDQCGRISSALHEVVRRFSEVECRNMRAALLEGRGGVWRCDPAPLQRQLEQRLVSSHHEAEEELTKLEADIFPQLRELLKRYSPQWGETGTDGGNVPGNFELPLLAVLGVPSISMELGEPRRKRWWSRPRNGGKRMAELAGLIEAEWRTITDKLVETARAHLEDRQSSVVQEAGQVYAGVVEVFKEQNRVRLGRARALIDSDKQPDSSELKRSRDAKMAELKTEISDLDGLADRLDKINRSMRWEDRTPQ